MQSGAARSYYLSGVGMVTVGERIVRLQAVISAWARVLTTSAPRVWIVRWRRPRVFVIEEVVRHCRVYWIARTPDAAAVLHEACLERLALGVQDKD